jgi:hypothetical protein
MNSQIIKDKLDVPQCKLLVPQDSYNTKVK